MNRDINLKWLTGKPAVSIITPAFNSGKYIREAIESVIAQSYSNWEMIVVDDCSKDDTCEIVERLTKIDARIRLVHQIGHMGPGRTRNAGLETARGRYLAFLDSDDLWLPNKLERQLEYMERSKVGFSFSEYRQMDESGIKYGRLIEVPNKVDYRSLLKGNVIGCLTVIIDSELIGPIRFPEFPREDFALWLEILKRGHVGYGLKEDLARYRIVGQSDSRNKWRAAMGNWRVYRKMEKLSLAHALYYFSCYAWNGFIKHHSLS